MGTKQSNRAPRSAVFREIQNGGRSFTLDWLNCLGWRRTFNNFVGFSFNWCKLRETFWKISSNLWKALAHEVPLWNVWESGYYFSQQEFLPYLQERQFVAFYISATICIVCLHLLNSISSVWPQTHRPIPQAWRVLYLQCTRTGSIFTLPYLIVFSPVL